MTEETEPEPARPVTGSRAARVALVLVLSAFAGVLAGVLIHNYRLSREQARQRQQYRELKRKYGQLLSRNGGPADPAKRTATMRAAHAKSLRLAYRNLVSEARRVSGAEGPAWERASEVLDRHFGPMEKALAAFERRPGWQPPDVRRVVGPQVATTLEELRDALEDDAWKKFDAWRRPKRGTAEVWRSPRYAYFLRPEEYQEVSLAATVGLRWNLARASVQKLYARLELPRHRQEELEAILRDHLNRYTAAVGGLNAGRRPLAGADERVREAIKLTEEKLVKLLGADKFKLYLAWRDSLNQPARGYFRSIRAGRARPEGGSSGD